MLPVILHKTALGQENESALKDKKVLLIWGGWKGHEPEQCRDIFIPWMQQEGALVTVSDTLDTYTDKDFMDSLDLIVQTLYLSQVTPATKAYPRLLYISTFPCYSRDAKSEVTPLLLNITPLGAGKDSLPGYIAVTDNGSLNLGDSPYNPIIFIEYTFLFRQRNRSGLFINLLLNKIHHRA